MARAMTQAVPGRNRTGWGPQASRRSGECFQARDSGRQLCYSHGRLSLRVFASVSPLGCCAVQVPEHAPPGVQEAGELAQCDVLLPPDLGQEGLRRLLHVDVQQVLIDVQGQLLPRLSI